MERFEVVRELGHGGMGTAILVRLKAEPAGQEQAIKKSSCGRNLALANKALAEALTLAALKHPHVVRISEVFLHQEPTDGAWCVCLVMEYCAAGDLGNYLADMRDQPLAGLMEWAHDTRLQMIGWMLQLAAALEFMHAQGIVHRDLKSANVFLQKAPGDSVPEVRLGDFGVATGSAQRTNLTHVGTLAYLAPEMLFRGQYSHQVDIWGFGCVCYEIMTGQFLWEHQGVLGAVVRDHPVLFDCPEFGNKWPLPVRQLVAACLRESADQRCACARALSLCSSPSRACSLFRARAFALALCIFSRSLSFARARMLSLCCSLSLFKRCESNT